MKVESVIVAEELILNALSYLDIIDYKTWYVGESAGTGYVETNPDTWANDSNLIYRNRFESEEIDNFKVCPVGMWSEKATLRFFSGAAENCVISERGNISIEVDSIDNVLAGKRVTYMRAPSKLPPR